MKVLLPVFLSSAAALWCNNSRLADTERSDFLNAHNTLRSQLAMGRYIARGIKKPQATNMLAMTWDCGIEASAQKYANTCPSGHSGSPNLGENLYWQWSSAPISSAGQGLKASSSWANEFQTNGFSKTLFTSDVLRAIGHATQMSWASTNRMGCAISQCPSKIKGFDYMVAVVCQYAPQGNYYNQDVYQSGSMCSAFPKGYQCDKITGLCTNPEVEVAVEVEIEVSL